MMALRGLICSALLCLAVQAKQFSEMFVEEKMRTYNGTLKYEGIPAGEAKDPASFRFLQATTQQYQVKSLPSVPFDIGEMYSGVMPIDTNDLTRGLFFVFQPNINAPSDTLTIWLNGGPGCSSLEGFFQENGRFLWKEGRPAPEINQHGWVNLTNMLWVEFPVGAGFSIGQVRAKGEEDIAKDFLGFFKNFQQAFGIKNFQIYVTGESYAGRYVPYISAAMLDQKNKELYDLQGALIYDGCIGAYDTIQQQVAAVPFIQENQKVMKLDDAFISNMNQLHQSCGYKALHDAHLQFPPTKQMAPSRSTRLRSAGSCDVFSRIQAKMRVVNPCFDIYMVNTTCPRGADPMKAQGMRKAYFDRDDVKAAMHAPTSIKWAMCGAARRVFTGGLGQGPEMEGDLSADPIQRVLPQVIDQTKRVIVAQGNYDMIIITKGTLMSVQNMTFGGQLGFQNKPATPITIPGTAGGVQHYERGLLWSEAFETGHMGPLWSPELAYRHIEWLLKTRETL